MHSLGLHVTRRLTRAVLTDTDGRIAQSVLVAGGDLAGSAAAAAREAAGGKPVAHVGLALDLIADAADRARLEDALMALHASAPPLTVLPGAAAVSLELAQGAARGMRHVIDLWIGDTVFAGILLDGRSWTGAHALAGSAAWLAMNPVERQDYRTFGSLAAEVSDHGIARRLAWRIQAGDQSAVLERAGELDAITATHVYEGARGGDGVAISVVRDTAKYVGMAVANLANAFDPEMVVISGSVAAYGDLLLEPIRQECTRRLVPALVEQLRVEMSPLGPDATAHGAALLAAMQSR